MLPNGRYSRLIATYMYFVIMLTTVRNSWEGSGLDEVGKEVDTGIERVKIDASLYRPNDVMRLRGSPMKAEALLGWRSRVGFNVCCS